MNILGNQTCGSRQINWFVPMNHPIVFFQYKSGIDLFSLCRDRFAKLFKERFDRLSRSESFFI